MAYIEYTDYTAYSTQAIDEASFPQFAEVASTLIDAITHNRINLWGGLVALPIFVQGAVKKAVCAEVQTLAYSEGDPVAAVEDSFTNEYQSETLGKYSYSKKNTMSEDVETFNGVPISPLVRPYLLPTGLLFSGTDPTYNPFGLLGGA